MVDKLAKRMAGDEEHSLDRRKISEDSKRELAEYIHHGDTALALDKMYRVITGDTISNHQPYRKVGGDISTTHTLTSNERLVVEVTIGTETDTVYIDDTQADTYLFPEVYDGTYDMSASVIELREYDVETMESTATSVDSATITMDSTQTVDTTKTTFGKTVNGTSIEISDLVIGGTTQ